ncbi:MAG: precorrin-8X methylmutase [Lachnospiraceae bacterium]|jgi:precorrin-8X/cobalt-precorrin-8 methylmutase|nr:precorrin-8X methylmutase [Lachnospiraceae bacterium]
MKIQLDQVQPKEIEERSFQIITEELEKMQIELKEPYAPIVKRVIHTTADFDYAKNLVFSPDVLQLALELLKRKACIVTDTQMAMAGINKKALRELGIQVYNFMGDEDVAQKAKENRTTRAAACMEKASELEGPVIFAIGNAPTALVRIYELVQEGKLTPALVIGTPVGFVNVEQSKELILTLPIPYMIARGRKGGSNVAAAIVNALLYQLYDRRLL